MDDYSMSSLIESKNEWCIRLLNILTPLIISGFNSIWKDAYQISVSNGEKNKYLMTFQNYLSQIPKWSTAIVENECKRIIENSGCSYLEDLLTCVHVIQLKVLSNIRVGQTQRKIDIDIPSLEVFIHKVYINCARKIYTNVYLFETNVKSLEIQKNNRELELIIRECIMDTVRESIPTEKILRAYMDETDEVVTDVKEEVIISEGNEDVENTKDETIEQNEKVEEPMKLGSASESKNIAPPKELPESISLNINGIDSLESEKPTKLVLDKQNDDVSPFMVVDTEETITTPKNSIKFNDTDETLTSNNTIESVEAPKDIDTLETISARNFAQRAAEASNSDDDDDAPLNIGSAVDINLDSIDLGIETL